jgi:biotin operon repressor
MERVINYISTHGSKENPVPNKKISSALETSETTIRKKINEARRKGIPICSCEEGYFYSEDKVEILKTVQSLMHRTIAVENAVKGLLTVAQDGLEVKQ